MVIFLLLLLLAQGITGLFANDEIFNTGPLYGYISDRLSLQLTSWHRRLFDWILIAVVLHVLAVIAHRVFAGHDLIGPMFSGRKPAQPAGANTKPSPRRGSGWRWYCWRVSPARWAGWWCARRQPAVFSFE